MFSPQDMAHQSGEGVARQIFAEKDFLIRYFITKIESKINQNLKFELFIKIFSKIKFL